MNRQGRETARARHAWTTLLAGTGFVLLATGIAWTQEVVRPRVIADFEDVHSLRIEPHQAEAVQVSDEGGHALQITTQDKASWPGVLLKPREKAWDLSGFDAVEVAIRNPESVSIRVLLGIHNPGADGQRHCSVGSLSVPARGRAVLNVPFGMWHGNFGDLIDQKNVVAVQVFLDKPGRSHRFLIDDWRAVVFDRSQAKEAFADPFFQQLQPFFGRGVNLGNALESPKEGAWGVVLKEEYFDRIKAAGFDSVRIPVRWSAHADLSAPYRIDPKFFDRVDWAIRQALDRGLRAVVNIHHYDEIFKEPEQHRERFLALWEQISDHYKDQPPTLAFELLNEPNTKLTGDKWNRFLSEAIAVVRRSNPRRDIVVGPVGWNSIDELEGLKLPEQDRHLIVTVHYYSPFQFTHQGASWVGGESQKWLGTKWTGSKAEQQAVVRDLDKAIVWAVRHRRPIYLGEFGAYSRADLESRARWTRFVAAEALKRKMGFAYWEFCSGFGVYDPQRGEWIEPLKEALLSGATR